MKCLYCKSKKTEVSNSRTVKNGVWRRRRCVSCGALFTTRETALADNLFVIKKNSKRQRFMYEKVFISIFSALNTKQNSDNGTNAKHAKAITESVIKKIIEHQGKEVSTKMIIVMVYCELKKQGRLYADHYAYYSEYRLQIAIKEGLITMEPTKNRS
jgi:transcriptional regulator NrdR family protein